VRLDSIFKNLIEFLKSSYLIIKLLFFWVLITGDPLYAQPIGWSDVFHLVSSVEISPPKENLIIPIFGEALSDSVLIISDPIFTRVAAAFQSNTGEYLHLIGANGMGPGEYGRPIDIASNSQHIYILDPVQNLIHIYDRNGIFEHAIKLRSYPARKISVSGSGEISVLYIGGGGAEVSILSPEGKKIQQLSLDKSKQAIFSSFVSGGGIYNISESAIYVALPYPDVIFRIQNGSIEKYPLRIPDFIKLNTDRVDYNQLLNTERYKYSTINNIFSFESGYAIIEYQDNKTEKSLKYAIYDLIHRKFFKLQSPGEQYGQILAIGDSSVYITYSKDNSLNNFTRFIIKKFQYVGIDRVISQ